MTLATTLDLVNLFFAGMLAGMEFAIHYGLRTPAETLDKQAQLQLRQSLILRLRLLVPAFFAPTALLGLALAVRERGTPGFGFRCAGLLGIVTWIWLRVIGTVPINSATIAWQPSAPPEDWKEQVDQAERFHSVGVWAAVLAFASSLAATALRFTVG